MFNLKKAGVRANIRKCLIDSAFDYAAECLETENPTNEQVMKFVVNDIKRVMDWRMKKTNGILTQEMVRDYLMGLTLAVEYTYFDEWDRMNKLTGENNDFESATNKQIDQMNEKYWNMLSAEIIRWDRN